MQVLVLLARRPGETASITDLVAEVWPRSVSADESLNRTVWNLRQALGDDPTLTYDVPEEQPFPPPS